jgi:non-ribosomal peptide synthase protein (TIGR01720 family)
MACSTFPILSLRTPRASATATAPPDLLLVAHHLVVDGVSWRILLDDLEAVCRRLQQHEPIALPPAAHAVRQWSDALHAFATTDAAREHLAMWRSATAAAPSLPCDFAKGPNSVGASRTRRLSIDADTTHALLHDPHARDAGAVDAMLLAALTHTLARDTGQRIWRIDVEGHGREALGGVDVSRTVGWFTAIYPVRLIAAADVLDTWRSVEASLRAIPQKKLTYGVLRYLDARPDAAGLAAAPHADVLFNYLGQADGVFSADRSLRPSTGPLGPMRRRGDVREYLLEINAIVTRGQLRVNWTYGTNHHATSTIERLGDGFADALRTLVTRRDIAREDERAASTFSHGVVDADELARIARALGDAP